MSETNQSKTLEVLRATVDDRKRPPGIGLSPTGVRLVNVMKMFGWAGARSLTIQEIVQISAVIICLDVLSQDIAKTTFRMYERMPGKGRREVDADEHSIAALLATEPNEHHTWYEFFEMVMLHMGLVQNAFIAKRLKTDGTVEELIPCMPARTTILAVTPEYDTARHRGFYAYKVDRNTPHEQIQLSGLPETFLPFEFIHFRGRLFDGLMGFSNLEAGAKTFGLANELTEYQTRLFKNDGALRGVFSHPGEIGEGVGNQSFEHLRIQLGEAMANMRRDALPILLEEGMKFEHIAMNADQAEVSKSRDRAVVDVAQTFRMPPHKIMHLVNVKYENMETLERSYVRDTLIPYCKRLEGRLERSLLSAKERAKYFFEFDRQELYLNDIEKKTKALEVQVKNGALTIDELRSEFGRNELPNKAGKVRIIPSTFNVVDDNNEIVVQSQGGSSEGGEANAGDEGGETDANKSVQLRLTSSGEQT